MIIFAEVSSTTNTASNCLSWCQIKERGEELERLQNEKARLEAATRTAEARLQKSEVELTEAGERYEERSEWLGRLEKEMAEQG